MKDFQVASQNTNITIPIYININLSSFKKDCWKDIIV